MNARRGLGWEEASPSSRGRGLIIALHCALLACLACLAAPPASAGETGEEPTSPSTSAQERYGRTPDTAIPFRNFHEPYLRFFQKPVEYYGSGRDEVETSRHDVIRIGFMGPVEPAPDGDLGAFMYDGAMLAVEQANADGGCLGRQVELVVREDTGLWGATSNEMVAFKHEDDVLAVLGSIDGANTHIALRVALKIGMPMVNTGTTDPTLTETNIPWLLRCMADDRQQGYALAFHIYQELGIGRVVAFRVNDRYGRMGIVEFRDAGRRLGHPLLGELRWDLGERSFERQLDRIEGMSPEAIVVWGNAHDAAAVVRAIRARGMTQPVFGPDRLASRAFVEEAGDAGEGVVAASSYDPTAPNRKHGAFVTAFADRFGYEPEAFAAHAYDGMNILLEVVAEGGPNRTLIRDALYRRTSYAGVTGEIDFDTTLNDVGPVYLATVDSGELRYSEFDFRVGSVEVEPYERMDGSAFGAAIPKTPRAETGSTLRVGCFLPLDPVGEAAVVGMRTALARYRQEQPEGPAVEFVVCDARGSWGRGTAALVDMLDGENLLAVIGSTERMGSHLLETMAAKLHLPVLPLCGTDPTLTAIPLPWVFCSVPAGLDPAQSMESFAEDAMGRVLGHIGKGARSRSELRQALAAPSWFAGRSGEFRFDELGNRIDRVLAAEGAEGRAP